MASPTQNPVSRTLCPLLVLLGLLLGQGSAWAQEGDFRVVVNGSNPASSMSRGDVSKAFLGKIDRWGNGFRLTPADTAASSPARIAFSQRVHKKDVKAIKRYWRKVTFSGLGTPPAELESDTAVLAFVRRNVGAIGYVSTGTALGNGVKTLEVTE